MNSRETYMGKVEDINGSTVRLSLSRESMNGFVYIGGQGYRVGQIGSFVRIPVGYSSLFGVVSQVGASAVPENKRDDSPEGDRWMTIQLVGEVQGGSVFQRGLSQYPAIGDEVHLVSVKELKTIYGEPNKPFFINLGHVSNAESISALVDVNKLVTRHSAVVGTTGSGKSTTVASIMNALSDVERYPSSRILIIDIHGEYGSALRDRANIYKVSSSSTEDCEKNLFIPFWSLNSEELCEIAFGSFSSEKEKNIILERILMYKLKSLEKYSRAGVSKDSLNVDTPIPFSIHKLWNELYIETLGTYYKNSKKAPIESVAYEVDSNNVELKGDPENGIPPVFKAVKNDKDDKEKIQYLPGSNNLTKQLKLLGSKLRMPRYDFLFKPGAWMPESDGKIRSDIDDLLKDWVGSEKPISILDLSGIPVDILQTVVGAVLRIIYEALFWARNLSQGGRYRPLLLVMEEAHLYLNNESRSISSSVVQKIVKEGRKYGIGAMIVSQRPSEINSTVLSQCGTFFALRLSNSSDRNHVTSVLPENLEGLTKMLPVLRNGEAIILGEAVKLPMRTSIVPPPKDRRPDSQDPIVYDEVQQNKSQHPGGWGIMMEKNKNYNELAEAWRSQNPKVGRIK